MLPVAGMPVTFHRLQAAELAFRAPHPRLAGYVLVYIGNNHRPVKPYRCRVTALTSAVLVIDIRAPTRRVIAADQTPTGRLRACPVSGLTDQPVVVEQSGHACGITALLTPLGARALFGLPLRELTGSSLAFADLLGADGRVLTERLAEAPTWQRRFDILDQQLAVWIGGQPIVPRPLQGAWQQLQAARGNVSITAVAERAGWTRQHLNARFHRELGLPLKTTARILRLQHAVSLMRQESPPTWGNIAAACGYTDQAHLGRDFRLLTGCNPTDFRALTTHWDRVFMGSDYLCDLVVFVEDASGSVVSADVESVEADRVVG